ncbi:MAG: sulfatase-like hydrolase/transferase, partial [Bacteroidales bacterium]|nr:sulfatase-like hydrolase/transferase [Bacteroidales bacterium]
MKLFYKQILFRYLLALAYLLITQIVFYLLNSSLFCVDSVGGFFRISLGNLRFGLSTLSVFLAPYLFFALLPLPIKTKKWYRICLSVLYFIGVEFILICNLIDCGYFRFTFKRLTFDIFNYLGVGGDFNSLIPQFIRDYWHIFLIFIILNVLIVFIDRKISKRLTTSISTLTRKTLVKESIVFVVSVVLLFVLQRGGLQYRPMGILEASNYTTTQNTALVLNTPYTLYRTIGKKGVEPKQYFKDDELANIFNPIQQPNNNIWADSLFTEPLQVGKTNVVLIIIESYAAEYFSTYNKTKTSYVPFLDSLAQHSLVFQGYSNGKRSIDGIPAVVSSMPILTEESYITSSYSGNELGSIAKTLREENYNTAFYHGGYNGTMNFNVFAKHV